MENLVRLLRLSLTKSQAEKVSDEISRREDSGVIELMAHDIVVVAEDMKSKTSAVVVRKQDDPEALRIAEMLKDYVLERYPYYAKQVNVSKWADDIRLLHSVDGVEYRAIEAIVRYLFEMYAPNSDFDWREQIRSGKNLRKHWIRLFELAKKVYEKSQIETV